MSAAVIVIALIVIGLALLAIEMLVIPGVGIIGVLGLVAVTASGYVAITELSPGIAAIAIAAGVASSVAMFWLFPRTRTARAMILETETTGSAADPKDAELIGLRGTALTPLRPAGSAEIADRTVDVVSDGQYVETGTAIQVVQVEGNRVVVEPLDAAL
ncbi:MAG: NfeD family protein [Myxococcota bacterium]